MTIILAAPHFGQSAVPGDTSVRQREQAGMADLLQAVRKEVASGYKQTATIMGEIARRICT